jgi:cell division protease FtsH
MNATLRNFAIWVIVVLLLLALFTLLQNPSQRPTSQDVAFSEFLDQVDRGTIRSVDIQGSDIRATTISGRSLKTTAPYDPTLAQRLNDKSIVITAGPPPQGTVQWLEALAISWAPFFALVGVWLVLAWWMRRGQSGAPGFGQAAAISARIVDDPAHWHACAGNARSAAEQFTDAQSRRQMLEIARSYEYLAQRAEERRRGSENAT